MPTSVGDRLGRRARAVTAVVLAATLTALASGCGVTRGADDADNRRLRMMIPNSPGGGYDLTGRAAARVMEDDGLTGRFEITNVIGASGTVAMQRVINESGADDLMLTMGLGVVGAVYTNRSDATVDKATPLARLLAVVAEVGADELVVGIRHRTAVGKAITGGVVQRLLLDSPVPVFAVKRDGRADSAV